ncbi:glycine cleavage system protein R [Gallaecimonas xiamenensis]|uniref:Glycine cleavage system transcriptional repressor n=1 Tax=Gallaecimonas xiamenensis 3-C-1 TaxID=745411 RepID=K2K0F0_9GAMM|nr:ACT domain-containing protein [Gallaecimonas xiamenensis]EKE76189.1 amino acid-binding ACT domain-containing protein [Gallaecimonas xiamenensis 3-C-1]
MSQFLVVTAVGEDRPGIVNELVKLASACHCNIVDSRMAILGNEFTLIMLISGDWNAVARLESQMPMLARDHNLLTMMKRTGHHEAANYAHRLELQAVTPDRPGVISQVTQFLAERQVNISALSASTEDDQLHLAIRINLPDGTDLGEFETALAPLCNAAALDVKLSHLTPLTEIRHKE